MRHTAFTIVTKIHPNRVVALKKQLNNIGMDIKNNGKIKFANISHLHHCCFFILDRYVKDGIQSHPYLIFEGNIDGKTKVFLKTLIAENKNFLLETYKNCLNFPDHLRDDTLLAFLIKHNYKSNTFYSASKNLTVNEVKDEYSLYISVQNFLDKHKIKLNTKEPKYIYKYLKNHIKKPQSYSWQPKKSIRDTYGNLIYKLFLFTSIILIVYLLLLLKIAIIVVILIALGIVLLRRDEEKDKNSNIDKNYHHWTNVESREDVQFQNHLTGVTLIKKGQVRHLLLRFILWFANISLYLNPRSGTLEDIASIHFARWVIIDAEKNRKILIFLSNYDGSWENYLGDFVDQASFALSAIWSNTEVRSDQRFPYTKWLGASGGAKDEQRFKFYSRSSQVKDLIWYSAYPHLSVKNIKNNREISRGLFTDISYPDKWLQLL